jgi:alkanesulfonate monooxygenase SsuD/methylene tetrahydromethanopterin reductase-like flavin-dependent oxidoreductase (luciferase family)
VTSLGVVFLPQFPPERLREVARAADDAGLDELWLWEDCFAESGIASAAAALAWTQWLRVSIGLLPAPLRNVAITAMEVTTLHRLFPDRVNVGVGHGVQHWMAQVGAQVESPVTLLREYLTALRDLLAGEQVSATGRYVRLDAVTLAWPPASAPPVLAGATGPRSLRLSGELADGTILSGGTSPEQVRAARRLIEAGRDAGGRTEHHPVTVYVHAATGPAAAERLEAERLRHGYDSMRDIGVAGDADAVAQAVQRFAAAGADTVVLQPTPDDPDPAGFVQFVAGEVSPLLRNPGRVLRASLADETPEHRIATDTHPPTTNGP